LSEWEAYEVVSGPIGDERLDHLFAGLQSTIANSNRGKRQKPFEAKQFLPRWGRAKEQTEGPLDGHALLAKVKSINRKMGGAESVDTR
jgi:hypothetical protein